MQNSQVRPGWLDAWMTSREITLWGAADLTGFPTPEDETGQRFPLALAWAIPMNPQIMASIQNGPNQAYADEYARVNGLINALAAELVSEIQGRGFRARSLAASDRSDPVNIQGDFPHKTAATRAGLGWIGRHCQLITRPYGPSVRLGTVFTDLQMICEVPLEKGFCGSCSRCVDACPAGALTGKAWDVSLSRGEILDARRCDEYKKKHYFHFHGGHNCNICSAVCPYGLKTLKQKPDARCR